MLTRECCPVPGRRDDPAARPPYKGVGTPVSRMRMHGINVRDDTSIAWDNDLFAADRETLRCARAFSDTNQKIPKAKCLKLEMVLYQN